MTRTTDTLTYTDVQATAFDADGRATTPRYFGPDSASKGLLPEAITDPAQIKQLTAYFAWSAWAAVDAASGQGLLLHQQLAAGASWSATR